MLCMEYAVGQLTQEGLISALGSLCPILKGKPRVKYAVIHILHEIMKILI